MAHACALARNWACQRIVDKISQVALKPIMTQECYDKTFHFNYATGTHLNGSSKGSEAQSVLEEY